MAATFWRDCCSVEAAAATVPQVLSTSDMSAKTWDSRRRVDLWLMGEPLYDSSSWRRCKGSGEAWTPVPAPPPWRSQNKENERSGGKITLLKWTSVNEGWRDTHKSKLCAVIQIFRETKTENSRQCWLKCLSDALIHHWIKAKERANKWRYAPVSGKGLISFLLINWSLNCTGPIVFQKKYLQRSAGQAWQEIKGWGPSINAEILAKTYLIQQMVEECSPRLFPWWDFQQTSD